MAKTKRSVRSKNKSRNNKKSRLKLDELYDGSSVQHVMAKDADARARLRREFIILICKGSQRLAVVAGQSEARYGAFPGFKFVCLGASNLEADISCSLIHELNEVVSYELSPKEFRITVAQDFLSRYLREVIEETPGTRALAVEILLYSPDVIVKISFDGEFEYVGIKDARKSMVLFGAHDLDFQKKLKKVFDPLLSRKKELTRENIHEAVKSTLNRYKIDNFRVVDLNSSP